jgi:flagellar hook-associated protein FlgK
MSSSPKDSSKLATAAEELIKAACSHVETASLSIGKETVEWLKKLSLDSASVEKSVVALKDSLDSKLNILVQSVSTLAKEIAKLNENIAAQTEDQKLQC